MGENIQQLEQILATSKPFEVLLADKNFLMWKELVVEKQLESLKRAVLEINRSEPQWKELLADRLIAYQTAHLTYEVIFKQITANADNTRSKLKKARVE